MCGCVHRCVARVAVVVVSSCRVVAYLMRVWIGRVRMLRDAEILLRGIYRRGEGARVRDDLCAFVHL